MRINSAWDSNSISTLFSSINTGNKKNASVNMNMNLDLSTLSLIKTGTYHKLLKSYYADPENSNITSTATSEDSTKTLAEIESSSSDLIASAESLYKDK